jgi:hypothetical protein
MPGPGMISLRKCVPHELIAETFKGKLTLSDFE